MDIPQPEPNENYPWDLGPEALGLRLFADILLPAMAAQGDSQDFGGQQDIGGIASYNDDHYNDDNTANRCDKC